MKSKFYIISDQIHSGKTTLLKNWSEKRSDVSGFLSPVIDDKRHFLNLKTQENRILEIENSNLKIGKYCFDEKIFQWAVGELEKQLYDVNKWLIIDEVGPLEIKFNKGFHALIEKIKTEEDLNKKVLFVVRDFLVADFIKKYDLNRIDILPINFFKNEILQSLHGIVLAGGKSTRMRSDKAFLQYENEEQWKVAAKLLQNFTEIVLLSINQDQGEKFNNFKTKNLIVDKEKYINKGPISGILSIAENYTNKGFMVLGVDYPFLKLENLIALNNQRGGNYDAICFEKEGFLEPLCTIYEKSAIEKMKIYFENGGESLSKFLKTIQTKIIKTEDPNFLRNVNSREEFLAIKCKLQQTLEK